MNKAMAEGAFTPAEDTQVPAEDTHVPAASTGFHVGTQGRKARWPTPKAEAFMSAPPIDRVANGSLLFAYGCFCPPYLVRKFG